MPTSGGGPSTPYVRSKAGASSLVSPLLSPPPSVVEGEAQETKKTRRPKQSLALLWNRFVTASRSCLASGGVKRVVSLLLGLVALLLFADFALSPPEKRLIQPARIKMFLTWVQLHPMKGLLAYVIVYGCTVVLLLPGTPLTIGSGYIYKMTYGWGIGVAIGSIFSTLGSLLGSVTCFCLGRYLMKEQVRVWVRKYPLFDAIDIAVGKNGFRIMALLYLSPVLPLGPVSYMCGTTSMKLSHFAAAKVACVPLMVFYTFIGASAGSLVHGRGSITKPSMSSTALGNSTLGSNSTNVDVSLDSNAEPAGAGDELDHLVGGESTSLIVFAAVLSMMSMALISHFVKKELTKVFNEQKKEGGGEKNLSHELELPSGDVFGGLHSPPRSNGDTRREDISMIEKIKLLDVTRPPHHFSAGRRRQRSDIDTRLAEEGANRGKDV